MRNVILQWRILENKCRRGNKIRMSPICNPWQNSKSRQWSICQIPPGPVPYSCHPKPVLHALAYAFRLLRKSNPDSPFEAAGAVWKPRRAPWALAGAGVPLPCRQTAVLRETSVLRTREHIRKAPSTLRVRNSAVWRRWKGSRCESNPTERMF